MGFVENFIRFPAVQKFSKLVKYLTKLVEFKGGNIFETQRRCLIITKKRRIE